MRINIIYSTSVFRAYLTSTGSVILIPSLLETVAICLQKFLNWFSLHLWKGAKQAIAQVLITAPWWRALSRISHEPSRGTNAWSCGPRFILGAGNTRPSTLTNSGSTVVWNSLSKYFWLVLINSWAYKKTLNCFTKFIKIQKGTATKLNESIKITAQNVKKRK